MQAELQYGNWVRKKNLLVLGIVTLATATLFLIPLGSLYQIIIAIVFTIVLITFLFPLYAYIMFSQKGGKLQEKVYTLLISNLGTNVQGKILDIGCGNGVLTVKLAQRYRDAQVVGIDYWGKDWEYSKNACEENARTQQVQTRVHFQKGNAAKLDFADGTFDSVTSNLTFHEVKSAADKRMVLQEALRVVKPGGSFAFVDYFYNAKYYGEKTGFKKFLHDMNLAQFEMKPLRDAIAIPMLLKHPKILGQVGIICGKK